MTSSRFVVNFRANNHVVKILSAPVRNIGAKRSTFKLPFIIAVIFETIPSLMQSDMYVIVFFFYGTRSSEIFCTRWLRKPAGSFLQDSWCWMKSKEPLRNAWVMQMLWFRRWLMIASMMIRLRWMASRDGIHFCTCIWPTNGRGAEFLRVAIIFYGNKDQHQRSTSESLTLPASSFGVTSRPQATSALIPPSIELWNPKECIRRQISEPDWRQHTSTQKEWKHHHRYTYTKHGLGRALLESLRRVGSTGRKQWEGSWRTSRFQRW